MSSLPKDEEVLGANLVGKVRAGRQGGWVLRSVPICMFLSQTVLDKADRLLHSFVEDLWRPWQVVREDVCSCSRRRLWQTLKRNHKPRLQKTGWKAKVKYGGNLGTQTVIR